MWKCQQNHSQFVIDTSLKCLSSTWVNTGAAVAYSKRKAWTRSNVLVGEKKLKGNIFVELFLSDLDEKMTSAS